jgi:hypothetical protein
MRQQAAAVRQQLFASGGELELSAHAAEQLESELLFQRGDLPRQRRLRDVEDLGRFGDRALLGDRYERSQAFEIHCENPCRGGIKM